MSEKNDVYDYYEERGEKKKKNWVVRSGERIMNFYRENEGFCNVGALVFTTVVGGVIGMVQSIARRGNIRNEWELKNLYVYDRKYGHYWKLKRPLSNKQRLEIEEAVNSGMRLGQILERMNVLKK